MQKPREIQSPILIKVTDSNNNSLKFFSHMKSQVAQATNLYGKFQLLGSVQLHIAILSKCMSKFRHKHKERQLHEKPEVNGEFYRFS